MSSTLCQKIPQIEALLICVKNWFFHELCEPTESAVFSGYREDSSNLGKNQGRIVDIGSPQELLARNPLFQRLQNYRNNDLRKITAQVVLPSHQPTPH
jgi:hypothetical protein